MTMPASPNHVTERPRGPGPGKEQSRQEKWQWQNQGGMFTAACGRSKGFQLEVIGKTVNNCQELSSIWFSLFLKRSLSVSSNLYNHRSWNLTFPTRSTRSSLNTEARPSLPRRRCTRMRSAPFHGCYALVIHRPGVCSCATVWTPGFVCFPKEPGTAPVTWQASIDMLQE